MSSSPQAINIDHLAHICRERSERGVATRADWERLSELDADKARRELLTYLQLNQRQDAPDPYDRATRPHMGLVVGFLIGVAFMSAYWLCADYVQRESTSSGKMWDVVTLTQYIAASLLPVFAWLGWRWDRRRASEAQEVENAPQKPRLRDLTWPQLLDVFDTTRKAGGTRMY